MFARRREDNELAREMASHIAMERDELIRQGVAPDEADRRARVSFGGVQRHTEAVRDERGTRLFGDVAQDVRFALRYFARAPFVTGMIVVLLAVAIGTNSIVFSLIDTMTMQQPAGVQAGPHVVRIRGTVAIDGRLQTRWMDYGEFAEYRAHTEVFDQVAGAVSERLAIRTTGLGGDTKGDVQFVTSGFFSFLGVTPALGGVLPADSDAAPLSAPSAVISHFYWSRDLSRSPDVIGKTITVGPVVATIVGVAPPAFSGLQSMRGTPTMVWLPYSSLPSELPGRSVTRGRLRSDVAAVARLRSGVSIRTANALTQVLGSRMLVDGKPPRYPQTTDVVPLRASNSNVEPPRGQTEIIAATGLVSFLILAIICSTVTALIVGRAVGRQREIGVRLSLGASRWRIIRQLLTESSMLAFVGGGVGLLLLAWLMRMAKQWVPQLPLAVGPLTVALTAALAIGTSVLIGLSPALHATRQSVFGALKESGGMSTWHTLAQRQLIVAQIALSQPLLVALGVLLVNALGNPRQSIDSELAKRVVGIELEIPRVTNYEADRLRGIEAMARVATQVREAPGVEGAAFGDMGQERGSYQVAVGNRVSSPLGDARFASTTRAVSRGYFDLLNIHITRGRDFDQTDVANAPKAVIIGSDLAAKLWGTADPIGRKLVNECKCDGGTVTVIGVFDARQAGPSLVDGRMNVFSAFAQYTNAGGYNKLWVRTAKNPAPMIALLRERIKQEAPTADIMYAQTLAEEEANRSTGSTRAAAFASVGGTLALLLAALGLYAVVSFTVGQRTREIGVRIALGAAPRQVVSHFFASGVKLALIGSAIGLPASAYAINSAMFGMFMRNDNVWMVGAEIAAVVTLVAMIATWIPARRAAHVDPMVALRTE